MPFSELKEKDERQEAFLKIIIDIFQWWLTDCRRLSRSLQTLAYWLEMTDKFKLVISPSQQSPLDLYTFL
jgi:hypothetical protein